MIFQFFKSYFNFKKKQINVAPVNLLIRKKIFTKQNLLDKMSFSTLQIKKFLNISNSTLANLRSSIRKKMGLRRAQSLTNSILSI